MRFPRRRRAPLIGVAVLAAVTMTAAACAGSGSDQAAASGLEKTDLNVGILPVADCAGLQLAINRGFFKAEGLNVKTQVLQGGAEAIPKLKSGGLDFTSGAYVPFFQAQSQGVIKLRIVGDAFQSAEGTHVVLVARNSPIHTVRDLKGKRIGVNAKHNLSSLFMQAIAQPMGVTLNEDKDFVALAFPDMQGALKNGSVDAVQAVEPFNTQLQQSIGARLLADTNQGETADFPISGYATTQEFAEENPKTVAAFQRALGKAQAMLSDRKVLEQVVPTYTKINAQTASSLHFGTFPTSLSITRLQRVADIMQRYGYLSKPLDVKTMVATGSPGTTG
jgi:NitT/TauT family transport system substrate-binding protein